MSLTEGVAFILKYYILKYYEKNRVLLRDNVPLIRRLVKKIT